MSYFARLATRSRSISVRPPARAAVREFTEAASPAHESSVASPVSVTRAARPAAMASPRVATPGPQRVIHTITHERSRPVPAPPATPEPHGVTLPGLTQTPAAIESQPVVTRIDTGTPMKQLAQPVAPQLLQQRMQPEWTGKQRQLLGAIAHSEPPSEPLQGQAIEEAASPPRVTAPSVPMTMHTAKQEPRGKSARPREHEVMVVAPPPPTRVEAQRSSRLRSVDVRIGSISIEVRRSEPRPSVPLPRPALSRLRAAAPTLPRLSRLYLREL
jgi:hypothetical protein